MGFTGLHRPGMSLYRVLQLSHLAAFACKDQLRDKSILAGDPQVLRTIMPSFLERDYVLIPVASLPHEVWPWLLNRILPLSAGEWHHLT